MIESTSLKNQALNHLKRAFTEHIPVEPIRNIIGETDINLAYEIQESWVAEMLEQGARKVGVKIGLTSEAVQKQLGVNQPDFGVLFAHTHIPNGGSIPHRFILQPKAEAEMAFVLSSDIEKPISGISSLYPFIEYVSPAIELVGSRISNWDIRITDTVADNASASHFILGDDRLRPDLIDFENAQMQLFQNGQLVSQGSAKACMGNPLNAVMWLINTFLERGVSMKKGDIILSGALGPMVACNPNDHFEAQIEGLGSVNFNITA